MLIGIDLGTTHCKAGAFDHQGQALHIASREVQTQPGRWGYAYYDPGGLWNTVLDLLGEVLQRTGGQAGSGHAHRLAGIGVAGMAETGLLIDRRTGAERIPFIPWFDPVASAQAEQIRQAASAQDAFLHRGLRPSFKFPVMKLLWLKDTDPGLLNGAQWLSAADYIAYRLTGQVATDPSLASRTFALDLPTGQWDADWLRRLGLSESLFPPILAGGQPVGATLPGLQDSHTGTSIPAGVPVTIAGHDHVCGAFAAYAWAAATVPPAGPSPADPPAARLRGTGGLYLPGATSGATDRQQIVFDSIGTAESLVGLFPARPLTEVDDRSGFAFGRHVRPGWMYWMGGLSSSGGSLEWLRTLLGAPPDGDPRLTYADIDHLLAGIPEAPTGILYYPYLAGSGSPHSDSLARGALVGLSAAHTRSHLLRAALEGVCYEIEWMRRRAEEMLGTRLRRILAAGGGTRNRYWMQIKADVSGCEVDLLPQDETTLLGAALLAGLGAGAYRDEAELAGQLRASAGEDAAINALLAAASQRYLPDPQRRQVYRRLYDNGFALLLPLVMHYYRNLLVHGFHQPES